MNLVVPSPFQTEPCNKLNNARSAATQSVQQSPVILDLCSRKTRAGKSRDYRDVIVFEKLHFQNVFRPEGNTNPAFLNFLKNSVSATD